MNPKVIIMRGLPGSGKSTLANKLVQHYQAIVPYIEYLETDEFFTRLNGDYVFEGRKRVESVRWNLDRMKEAIRLDVPVIIVDDVHAQFWEIAPYVEYALNHGYDVQLAETNTDWRYNLDKLAEKNKHGVTLPVLRRMWGRWQSTRDLLEDFAQEFLVDSNVESNTLFAVR